MTTPLSNATVNIRIEVRLAGADGFAVVTAPMLMLEPQVAAAVAATLRSNGAELLPPTKAHAMADLIDEALDRAAVLDTLVFSEAEGWAA